MKLDIFQGKKYGLFCTNSATILLKVFSKCYVYRICTGICMEMNNLRVGELVVKVLRSESEGSRFKPHYQDVKKKVYPRAVSSKLGNSRTHKKNNCLFEIKKFLMQRIILWKIWHHQESLVPAAQVHISQ